MRKLYQKTCPLCGEKMVVSNKADFAKHVCKEKPKPEKQKKKWQGDDNV